ncbi:MAG TPA: NADPH-dependent F420 reductase [Verrucomicrobiae bacterium]|nr:NADPH-dependent F420 reductase [Verrucomicrobiae bacterium]
MGIPRAARDAGVSRRTDTRSPQRRRRDGRSGSPIRPLYPAAGGAPTAAAIHPRWRPTISPALPSPIAILGGTGPLGRGLALRWARAGCAVVVGSREATRAEALAAELRDLAGPTAEAISGAANERAAHSPVVCLAVPYPAQAPLATGLAPQLGDRIVVATAVPMSFGPHGPVPFAVPAGSAAQELSDLCPTARVVAAFHTVSAHQLLGPADALAEDVLVTSDDREAATLVVQLVARIPGLRALDAGPLVGAAATERLTPVLLRLNRRHRAELGLRLAGLPDPGALLMAAWVEAYRRAWLAGDAAAAAALFTPEGRCRSHPLRPDEAAGAYTERSFRDMTTLACWFGRPVGAGPDFAVEYWAVVRQGATTTTRIGGVRVRLAPDGRCMRLRDTWVAAEGRHDPTPGWGD